MAIWPCQIRMHLAMTNKHQKVSSGFVPISYQTFAYFSQVKIDQLATGCIKTGNGDI